MDHAIYAYSALPRRPAWLWPQGAGLASFVVLFLEHWEFMPLDGALRDPRMVGEFGSFSPDYRSWTQREYGLRVGIFRVIEALREAGIRPAVAANAMAMERLPRLVDTFNAWGCEWLGHGLAATRMQHAGMDRALQRAEIDSAIASLVRHTGQRPAGWVSQDWGTTPDTAALLAEAGIRYTLDWSNDDQPYALQTAPPLVALPLSSEWDDVQCQWLRHLTPQAHADLAGAAFERLRAESARQQRAAVFGLALHPWLCGMPSRVAALRGLLARLRAAQDVLWARPRDLIDALPKEALHAHP